MSVDLQLGAVDLLGTSNTSPGWWLEACGDDMSLGSPADVEREVQSFLQDGSIITVDSRDNREMTLPIKVRGTSVAALGAGEAALMAELGKRNVLTYTPSGNGAVCVFDVVTSSMVPDFDDVAEANSVFAVYSVTIKALPWVHAVTPTTVSWTAPAAGAPTVTTVDACTSTSGWAKFASGGGTASGPSVSSGTVTSTLTNSTATNQVQSLTESRTGLSASMASTPYVRLDFATSVTGGVVDNGVTVTINGTFVPVPVAQNGSVSWYAMPGGATTLTGVSVARGATTTPGGGITVTVADISRSSAPSDAASGQRQSFRTVQVAGSARTPTSIALSDATPASLGSVLVYTAPASAGLAQPNLRARLWSGSGVTETTDASAVSGKTSPLSASVTGFDTPASQAPFGSYVLLARVKNAAAGSYPITGSAYSVLNAAVLGNVNSRTDTFTLAAGAWTVVPIWRGVLPTVRMGSAGIVRAAITTSASGMVLDEAWLFNLDKGRLTWVECGTASPSAGVSASRVWLDAPTLNYPAPATVLGTAADRSDSWAASGINSSPGPIGHVVEAGALNLFVVNSNSVATAGSITYYANYHTRVAG